MTSNFEPVTVYIQKDPNGLSPCYYWYAINSNGIQVTNDYDGWDYVTLYWKTVEEAEVDARSFLTKNGFGIVKMEIIP